ncbi:MAG: DUF2786 domain-containing protein [Proteobacteria bacterium]|nr:DUF2786 domain-containing protein [Pseudomonadota bacterium]
MKADPLLEHSLLNQLHHEWAHANWYYLREAMINPIIGLSNSETLLGQWCAEKRLMLFSRSLVLNAPWEQVVEVLRHEMAHQFVHEVLRVTNEPPHGLAWQQTAKRLAVDPVIAGLAESTVEAKNSKIVRRLRKLLSLANSPNPHEAEAAMAKAQQLMLKHNIDLAGSGEQQYTSRIIGPKKLRFERWEQLLVAVLTRHFFVRAIWISTYLRDRRRAGRATEYTGTPANLQMAEYVHGFLSHAAKARYLEFKRTRPKGRRHERAEFLNGVIRGFEGKLRDQREKNRQEGLVWVEDPGLVAFEDCRHPITKTRRRALITLGSAYAAGHSVGGEIVLNRPLTQNSRQRGLLLKG